MTHCAPNIGGVAFRAGRMFAQACLSVMGIMRPRRSFREHRGFLSRSMKRAAKCLRLKGMVSFPVQRRDVAAGTETFSPGRGEFRAERRAVFLSAWEGAVWRVRPLCYARPCGNGFQKGRQRGVEALLPEGGKMRNGPAGNPAFRMRKTRGLR